MIAATSSGSTRPLNPVSVGVMVNGRYRPTSANDCKTDQITAAGYPPLHSVSVSAGQEIGFNGTVTVDESLIDRVELVVVGDPTGSDFALFGAALVDTLPTRE